MLCSDICKLLILDLKRAGDLDLQLPFQEAGQQHQGKSQNAKKQRLIVMFCPPCSPHPGSLPFVLVNKLQGNDRQQRESNDKDQKVKPVL